MNNAFDERRQNDPQGVIDDLLRQITRQGKEIHDCGVTIGNRDAEIAKLIKDHDKEISKLKKPEAKSRYDDIPFDPD